MLINSCAAQVSMPTGSLCAERNVIGTALSSDLSLKRQDLKAIAVLSVSLKQDYGSDDAFKLLQKNPSITKQNESDSLDSASQKSGTAKLHVTYDDDDKSSSNGQPGSPSRQRVVRVFGSLSSPKSAALLDDQTDDQQLFSLPPAVQASVGTPSLKFPDSKCTAN